jgi:hypothetical protein
MRAAAMPRAVPKGSLSAASGALAPAPVIMCSQGFTCDGVTSTRCLPGACPFNGYSDAGTLRLDTESVTVSSLLGRTNAAGLSLQLPLGVGCSYAAFSFSNPAFSLAGGGRGGPLGQGLEACGGQSGFYLIAFTPLVNMTYNASFTITFGSLNLSVTRPLIGVVPTAAAVLTDLLAALPQLQVVGGAIVSSRLQLDYTLRSFPVFDRVSFSLAIFLNDRNASTGDVQLALIDGGTSELARPGSHSVELNTRRMCANSISIVSATDFSESRFAPFTDCQSVPSPLLKNAVFSVYLALAVRRGNESGSAAFVLAASVPFLAPSRANVSCASTVTLYNQVLSARTVAWRLIVLTS